jgi:hypothetical protein
MEATHERLDLYHWFDRRDHVHPFVPRIALIASPIKEQGRTWL